MENNYVLSQEIDQEIEDKRQELYELGVKSADFKESIYKAAHDLLHEDALHIEDFTALKYDILEAAQFLYEHSE